jgi:hypothetical protein
MDRARANVKLFSEVDLELCDGIFGVLTSLVVW